MVLQNLKLLICGGAASPRGGKTYIWKEGMGGGGGDKKTKTERGKVRQRERGRRERRTNRGEKIHKVRQRWGGGERKEIGKLIEGKRD